MNALPEQMRKLSVGPEFGISNLALRTGPLPTLAEGEVLLRVRAASLNYRDLLVVLGKYNPRYPLPLTVGSDAVGEVAALGPNTEHAGLALGDRVSPLFAQGWLDGPPVRSTPRGVLGGPLPGVFADYVAVRADSTFKVPTYLSDVEAACLPCAALTAFSALCMLSPLEPAATLLTLGSGGVSVFALQLAKALGARVLVTTRDMAKAARLQSLGADAVVDGASDGWGERARQLANGGEGVDHVIEVGGGSTLAQSLRAVRPGGVISLIGVLGGSDAAADLLPIVMRNVRVQGVFVGHARGFRDLLTLVEKHEVHPAVHAVYDLSDFGAAFAELASGRHIGKICLRIND